MNRTWKTSRREISLDRPLVMGILNVTPDSFSDGGQFADVDRALRRAEEMVDEGVDIIDVGGESTRPASEPVDPEIELRRTVPIVYAIAKRFDLPISIDTTKHLIAQANLNDGAEIINDISGLRWDARIADIAARSGSGLVLMHSRGEFGTMHAQPPVENIFAEINEGLSESIRVARKWGVADANIALDLGVGFGKTLEQNLELIAKLGKIDEELKRYPLLVGASRKSFIGRIAGEETAQRRLGGSIAAALAAIGGGAGIVRVHDVRETVQAIKVSLALRDAVSI